MSYAIADDGEPIYQGATWAQPSHDYLTKHAKCNHAWGRCMHEPQMVLSDDGTLDTVIECAACHREYRFNFDSEEEGLVSYENFVEWCLTDAGMEHAEDQDSDY